MNAVSTGRRNSLIFLERWSIDHEVSDTGVLYGQLEVRDVAAWWVNEFDCASLQSCVIFGLPSFAAIWWDPPTATQPVMICFKSDGAGGDVPRACRTAVVSFNRRKPKPIATNYQPRGSQELRRSNLSCGLLRPTRVGLRSAAQVV